MMTTIKTKYSIGDVVWHASTHTERKSHPCPDCKGSNIWTAFSPAGSEYTLACPRCSASYISDRDISLEYSSFEPTARKLTIGSIRFDSHSDTTNEYMCVETGVGSGNVYKETSLFGTEQEALEAAKIEASKQNQNIDWVVRLYDKSLSISDYQLDSAKIKNAASNRSANSALLYNLGYLFDEIIEAENKDEILVLIEDYRARDWTTDKAKAAKVAA